MQHTILIIEDKESMVQMLTQTLEAAGYKVESAMSAEDGIQKLNSMKIDLILTDLRLPGKSGMDVLTASKEKNSLTPVIVMTAFGTIETAVQAVKEGAYDFLTKPFDPDHLLLLIERALEKKRLQAENIVLKGELSGRIGLPTIIGKRPKFLEAVNKAEKVSQGRTTALLLGESGTGKELFARLIHYLSPRKNGPFVAINCAAIPRDLLESELFGHEAGAFTDAKMKKIGKFELADKGTIFLDEIGDMDLNLQAKLLRVLQGDEFMRLGGNKAIKIDVRVVAASNKDLQKAISEGAFREDLYYRLSAFPIVIPPLRERTKDIQPLAGHFLGIFSKEMNKDIKGFTKEALRILLNHHWKGNVRELENCIERAVILCSKERIMPEDLGLSQIEVDKALIEGMPLEGGLQEASGRAIRIAESRLIKKVLDDTGWNKTKASEILKISYKTLLTKIKEYGIE
ncbi:MAG: sigma-54-dependent Fis family transcriptional regulator [Nitrospirae bacterium]|nr:sigma-54-dependent Fis family transcriptional regulator [Nitrospirota bacterium]